MGTVNAQGDGGVRMEQIGTVEVAVGQKQSSAWERITSFARRSMYPVVIAVGTFAGLSGQAPSGEKPTSNRPTASAGAKTEAEKKAEEEKKQYEREWARRHILKDNEKWKTELDPFIDVSRKSHDAEKYWLASLLKPDKYVRLSPTADENAARASTSSTSKLSGTRVEVFQVVIKDKNNVPHPARNTRQFLIGTNSIAAMAFPTENPYGIVHSWEVTGADESDSMAHTLLEVWATSAEKTKIEGNLSKEGKSIPKDLLSDSKAKEYPLQRLYREENEESLRRIAFKEQAIRKACGEVAEHLSTVFSNASTETRGGIVMGRKEQLVKVLEDPLLLGRLYEEYLKRLYEEYLKKARGASSPPTREALLGMLGDALKEVGLTEGELEAVSKRFAEQKNIENYLFVNYQRRLKCALEIDMLLGTNVHTVLGKMFDDSSLPSGARLDAIDELLGNLALINTTDMTLQELLNELKRLNSTARIATDVIDNQLTQSNGRRVGSLFRSKNETEE